MIAHLSDTHFLAGDRPLYGVIQTHANLIRALEQLERSGTRPSAIVFTGDLADLAEPEAYQRLRATVEPAAARMGATIIWGMGNHDERRRYAVELFDLPSPASDSADGAGTAAVAGAGAGGDEGVVDDPAEADFAAQDRVYDIDGLRIIALDSTVPGYHHGELTDAQLRWLSDELATPAPHGTLLAMHHPPIPTSIDLLALLELQGQARFADVIRGTDVRAILAGHLHYSTHSMFAGVPVSVVAATCYTMDLSAELHTLSGIDGGQAFNLVQVYDDQVVHSVVPIGNFAPASRFSALFVEKMAELSPHQRREVFSRKSSTLSVADIEAGRGAAD